MHKKVAINIITNNLHESLLSADKSNHSTETALVKQTNDIPLTLDKTKQCAKLVLLDLSIAFDTIDHHVFLAQLERDYGTGGRVNDWMDIYTLLVRGNEFRLMEYPLKI